MFNILNYFRDDRKKAIIVIICFFIIMYGIVMYFNYLKKMNNEYSENNSSSSNNTTAIIKNETVFDYTENTIQNTKVNTSEETIKMFVNYCNNKNTSAAYEMLTSECKEIVFNNNQNNFINKYINNLFDKQMSYEITMEENSNSIYKVNFFEDPIDRGTIDKSNSKSDYITVVENQGTYKLNVSGFVEKESLNVSSNNNYMEVQVQNRLIFHEYEIYTFYIKNNILVDFTLDNMKDNTKTYIQDSSGNKFNIVNEQYTAESARVSNGKEKNISLKFDRKYMNNNKTINKIVFSRISVLNRNYYQEIYNDVDNTISYQEKMSTYPAVLSLEINL